VRRSARVMDRVITTNGLLLAILIVSLIDLARHW
jgi:hypothetical protein